MKYRDRKHQRAVNENVGSLLASIRTYCNEDLKEYITDAAITILNETEIEGENVNDKD